MKRKLLIGTTNRVKLKEISDFLATLPFELVFLSDLKETIPEPEENEPTIEGNAIIKAGYYGERTGLLTLVDDTGLFIDALEGWPGVKAGRIESNKEERIKLVLDRLKDVSVENRGAEFRSVMVLHDPLNDSLFISSGKIQGKILLEAVKVEDASLNSLYAIFFCEELGKTFAEMAVTERNSVSQRGQALAKIKYHLQNTYSGRHIVVPCALIIKDGKLLMSLRNDPHRLEFHKKWEYPGGTVEFGEQVEDNLRREVKEEIGYEVEIVKLLQRVTVESRETLTYKYQCYLLPYVCRISGGSGEHSDEEVLETRWFELDEVLDYELLGANAQMFEEILPELKMVIAENGL
ncbi:MAG: non-canonical purine NTP pyrophosphatase [Patescibacteria group bacterium]